MLIRVNDVLISTQNMLDADVVEKPEGGWTIEIRYVNGEKKYTGNYDQQSYGYDILNQLEIIE